LSRNIRNDADWDSNRQGRFLPAHSGADYRKCNYKKLLTVNIIEYLRNSRFIKSALYKECSSGDGRLVWVLIYMDTKNHREGHGYGLDLKS
jgi:hypothetical protein